ncbi:hypothetical protein K439DRAFT_1367617 [Ramaria rubella]|nr:hypothetical protein K439DRAFT_1367617 [Ramaria rubella]
MDYAAQPGVNTDVGAHADKSGRDHPSSYRMHQGEVAGSVNLVTGWCAIGRPDQGLKVSHDILGSGAKYNASCALLKDLSGLSQAIHLVFEIVDPPQHTAHEQLLKTISDQYPAIKVLVDLDPKMVWQARSIMYNRQTPLHRDSKDPIGGWEALLALGKFTGGGFFFIPRLNLKIRYGPGDLILLRGGLLKHEVEAWENGQRVSIAYYTHKDTWVVAGLEVPQPF